MVYYFLGQNQTVIIVSHVFLLHVSQKPHPTYKTRRVLLVDVLTARAHGACACFVFWATGEITLKNWATAWSYLAHTLLLTATPLKSCDFWRCLLPGTCRAPERFRFLSWVGVDRFCFLYDCFSSGCPFLSYFLHPVSCCFGQSEPCVLTLYIHIFLKSVPPLYPVYVCVDWRQAVNPKSQPVLSIGYVERLRLRPDVFRGDFQLNRRVSSMYDMGLALVLCTRMDQGRGGSIPVHLRM